MNETKELIKIASDFCELESTENENSALNYKRCRYVFTAFEEVLESMQDNDTLVLGYANICSEGKKHCLKAKIRHNVGRYKIIYDFEFTQYTGKTDKLKHYSGPNFDGSFKLTKKVLFFNHLKFKNVSGTIIDDDCPVAWLSHMNYYSDEHRYNKRLKEILFKDIRSTRALMKRVKFDAGYFRPIYNDLRRFLCTNCTELENHSGNNTMLTFHLSKNRRVILDIQKDRICFTGVNGDLIKNHTIPTHIIYTGPFNLFLRSQDSVLKDLKQQLKLTKLI